MIGGVAVFIYYFTILKIGLAKATVIGYSFPIFASIFSFIFLKEKISIVNGVAILLSFVGIYFLTRVNGAESFFAGVGKYELLSVFGAMLGGAAVVIIKKLHDTESSYGIYFAQCAIGLWLMIFPASVVSSKIGLNGAWLLLGIGATATVGQLLMTQGYSYLKVSMGGLLSMLTPVLNFVIAVILFKEAFTRYSIVGAAFVIGSCAVVLKTENKQ